jgi:tRNA A-37 threonylcarbamoyl transferase component Bud32
MSETLHDTAATPDLSTLQAQLQDRLRHVTAAATLVTEKITHGGQSYIVKFRQPGQVRHVRSWLVSLGCVLLLRLWVRPARLRAGGLAHEAQRLRQLHAAGVQVPQVVLQTADYLVLEFCGENLTRCLQLASPAEKPVLLERVFDALASFHRAGHWHGGAQVRNLTLHDGEIYRIDFEEAAGNALPLAVMQAYDVLLTLQSVVEFLAGMPQAAVAQGLALLQRYFEQAPDDAVRQALCRLERVTCWLLTFETMLEKPAQKHRDVRRALLLAQLLRAYRVKG